MAYHRGELEVQERAGVRAMAARISGVIRPELPPAGRDLLEDMPVAVVGSAGADGRVWASLLTGEPGLLRAPDEKTLLIWARPAPGDPLNGNLTPGAGVGVLAIDPSTRQRVRINGKVEAGFDDGGIRVRIEQAYANCQKYIQARRAERKAEEAVGGPGATRSGVRRAGSLTAEQGAWISSSDTFFIASAHPACGADASHRGGNPGFVRLIDEETLVFPDYSGNTMFNTLGNIAANPKAGLLFVDFERGGTLQLSGEARILWDEKRVSGFAGAERVVEFRAEEVVDISDAAPLRWRFEAYSPFNPG